MRKENNEYLEDHAKIKGVLANAQQMLVNYNQISMELEDMRKQLKEAESEKRKLEQDYNHILLTSAQELSLLKREMSNNKPQSLYSSTDLDNNLPTEIYGEAIDMINKYGNKNKSANKIEIKREGIKGF